MSWLDLFSGSQNNGGDAFCMGEHVMVKYSGLEGTIIDKNGDYYLVAFSNGKGAESYRASELQKSW